MDILTKQPSVKGPADTFIGDAWYDPIAGGAQWTRMRVSTVWFAPGARTAWHAHPRGQTLCVTEGRGRAQSRGGAVLEIHPGDVVHTPAGGWHWHGAAPEHFMAHLSMLEVDDEGTSATWGEHVTDAEYQAPPENNESRAEKERSA